LLYLGKNECIGCHGINNLILTLLALTQLITGWGIIKLFVLGGCPLPPSFAPVRTEQLKTMFHPDLRVEKAISIPYSRFQTMEQHRL